MTFPRCVCPFPADVWWTCKSKKNQWNHIQAAWGCLTRKNKAGLGFLETKLWSQFRILWFWLAFCIPASWALVREQGPRLECDEQGLDLSLGMVVSPKSIPCGSTSGSTGTWAAVATCILVMFWWCMKSACYSPASLKLIGPFPLDHFQEKSVKAESLLVSAMLYGHSIC